MGHEEHDERLLSSACQPRQAAAVPDAHERQRSFLVGRLSLGGRDEVLLRRHRARERGGQRKDFLRPRRLSHYPAGQEILQHAHGRVRLAGERVGGDKPDLHERQALRGGGGSEHDPMRRRGLVGLFQGRRRRDDLRLYEAHGKQQNGGDPRDRRRQDVFLRIRLHARRGQGRDALHRERKHDGSAHGSYATLYLRKRKSAVGLRRYHHLRLEAGRSVQLERVRGAGYGQLRGGYRQRGQVYRLRLLPRLPDLLQGGPHLQGLRLAPEQF